VGLSALAILQAKLFFCQGRREGEQKSKSANQQTLGAAKGLLRFHLHQQPTASSPSFVRDILRAPRLLSHCIPARLDDDNDDCISFAPINAKRTSARSDEARHGRRSERRYHDPYEGRRPATERFITTDTMSFSPNGEEDPAKQRELRKLWRAWRTVHEMCQDRVRYSWRAERSETECEKKAQMANRRVQGYELAEVEVKISFDEFLNKFTMPDGTAEYVPHYLTT
jgi:hypothetical protein